MSSKKLIFIISFLAIFVFLFNFGTQSAEAMTAAEIQALIQQLQQQIAQLQKQLAEMQVAPAVWCHDFKVNLRYDMAGAEVEALQTALEKEGFKIAEAEKTPIARFRDFTASAVVGFQEKYKEEILDPWGLKHGTGFVGPTTRAMLNELYGCPPPEVKSYIKVLSPNGGEKWVFGNTYDITWTSTGVNNAYIYLWFSDGGTCKLADVPARDGKYSVKLEENQPCPNIPTNITAGQYKILITTEKDLIKDSSDDYFTIVSLEKSITVISPNGGEKWVVGNTYSVKLYCSQGISKVLDIWLLDKYAEGGTVTKIASGVTCRLGETSAYSWTIPSFIYPRDNAFKVMAETIDHSIKDESDNYFSIVKAITEVYEINPYDADVKTCTDSVGRVWPATGEGSADWFVWGGCTHNKYYFVNPGQQLKLRVRTDSCPGCVCYYPNFYLYEYENGNWIQKKYFDLPDVKGITRDEYYTPSSNAIRIYAPNCFYLRVYSPEPVKRIMVISPNGGERWIIGHNYFVTWKASGVDKVNIELENWEGQPAGGPLTWRLGTNIPAVKGEYLVGITQNLIPAITTGNYYKIRVVDAADTSPYAQQLADSSDNYFSIVEAEKSITVISPNGGETLKEGEIFTIRWKSEGLPTDAKVYIILFRSDGANASPAIARDISVSQNYYNWKVTTKGLDWGFGYLESPGRVYATLTSDQTSTNPYQYKIFIGIDWPGYDIWDKSDNYFSIVEKAAGSLTVSTSPDIPHGQTYIRGTKGAKLLKINFTAGPEEDIKVSEVMLEITRDVTDTFKYLQRGDLSNGKLLKDDGTLFGTPVLGWDFDDAALKMDTQIRFWGNLVIKAGTTKSLTLVADISSTTTAVSFESCIPIATVGKYIVSTGVTSGEYIVETGGADRIINISSGLGLQNIETQLASIANAVSRLIESLEDLMGR